MYNTIKMIRFVRSSFPVILFLCCMITAFITLYICAAVVCSLIPAEQSYQPADKPIPIYLLSNGVHTDFVFPLRTEMKDWSQFIDIGELIKNPETVQWIAFGWGDRTFYIETPTWEDLTAKNAFSSLFLPTPSAIHVTLYYTIFAHELCIPLRISEEQYQILSAYVESTFQKTKEGKPIRIGSYNYFECDGFYEAHGYFHLFKTCNTWTNTGLKRAGLPAALWTPVDKGILYHYRNYYTTTTDAVLQE